MFDQFTLGIEEEFQIVDPETRELKSHVSEILEEGKLLLGEKIKPEMIQSMIEVGTGVCANIQEAREDLTKLRCIISGLAQKKGMAIVAASTHPFSKWSEQEIYDGDRYKLLVDELQMVARSLLIFGLHVHVGIPGYRKADTGDECGPIFSAAHSGPDDVITVSGWGLTRGSNRIVLRSLRNFPARRSPIRLSRISSIRRTSIC